ncbi:hypothetical protein IHV10_22370 [Fictibacillus sp. 5RED26]|uniref:hypothetical protein n=1 Tax=Fictibacillus sp. 5RED26 TaxID=2745876 RepID=UPI0018CE4522|nr:hypothetical protein [Fictibacillus sp. 5RED26]MBH0159119.1 hypothetical protein [Fictibacillus sp. 5RED26]
MNYKVLNTFVEVEHDNTLYEKGDVYPKENFKADPDRVSFLQSDKNRYNQSFLGKEIKPKNSDASTPETQEPDTGDVDESKKKESTKTQSKGKGKNESSEEK